METQEKKEFVCPICLKEVKESGHLMGPSCYEKYQDTVVNLINSHRASETPFSYTKRVTQENLVSRQRELDELKEKTRTFFTSAYNEVQRECRTRLDSGRFMECVLKRLDETLERAGQKETGERIKTLKKEVEILKQQAGWIRHIEEGRRIKKAAEKTAPSAATEKVAVA